MIERGLIPEQHPDREKNEGTDPILGQAKEKVALGLAQQNSTNCCSTAILPHTFS